MRAEASITEYLVAIATGAALCVAVALIRKWVRETDGGET